MCSSPARLFVLAAEGRDTFGRRQAEAMALRFLDPLSYVCTNCGERLRFFDSARDGYDGLLNGGAAYMQGDAAEATACNKCGQSAAFLKCALAYNVDFEEEGDIDLLANAQDYFDSIDVSVTCSDCGTERHIGSWETS